MCVYDAYSLCDRDDRDQVKRHMAVVMEECQSLK